MNFANLIDPAAALVVGGGTGLATVLRCGRADCMVALAEVAALVRPRFRAALVRAEIGALAQQLQIDGLFRARRRPTGDEEFDALVDAMIAARSGSVVVVRHAQFRRRRLGRSARAARTLVQGADLAPVFGLAATLLSLSQLSTHGIARAMFMSAISGSVLATLYGLLLANLLLAPLARAVERRHERDEAARQDIVDWLVAQAALVAPHLHDRAGPDRASPDRERAGRGLGADAEPRGPAREAA